MKGYKVFVSSLYDSSIKNHGWTGPVYTSNENWDIRAHRTIQTGFVNDDIGLECAFGIHFYRTLKGALKNVMRESSCTDKVFVIFAVHTTKNSQVIVPKTSTISDGCPKARTNSLRLDRVVGYYYNGKKVKKLPPIHQRSNYYRLQRFYGR